MNRMKLLIGLVASATLLSGCASSYPIGVAFTDVKLPLDVTGNVGKGTKTGEAECMSVLSLVATGDCSVEAAKQRAGITKVYSVDWKANNILGLIGNYKIIVTGE